MKCPVCSDWRTPPAERLVCSQNKHFGRTEAPSEEK